MNDATDTDTAAVNGEQVQETEVQETEQLPLQRRLGIVLSRNDTNVSSDELRQLIAETETAAAEADVAAQQFKAASLDLDCEDPVAADQAQKAKMVERQRLLLTLPRLEDKLRSAVGQENHDRWRADRDRVAAKRDAAVRNFRAYPEIIAELIEIFQEAKAVDAEVDRVNQSASAMGCEHLQHVEVLARKIPDGRHTREQPEISETCVLPDWNHSNKQAWPPPRQSLGLLIAAASPPAYHPGDRWFEQQNERRAAQDADDKIMTDYYQRVAKEREAKEAKEAALADAERQRQGYP
jgi:hypothetical protein